MSAGKTAAQAAHAAVGLLRVMQAARTPWLHAWEGAGEKTVVLDVPTAEAASLLAAKATQLSLPGACYSQRSNAARRAHVRASQCMQSWMQVEQRLRLVRSPC